MRLVVIGDVGVTGDMMHIGDEAMFEALVDELRQRGATQIVAISHAPSDTARRYGISAVSPIGFTGDRERMAARLADVEAFLTGRDALPADDPLRAVSAAVEEADAVAIAGGGNMASTWPMHVHERAALGLIAARFGRPLVISGQTFGPHLVAPDRTLLGSLVRGARLVGVRERATEELARERGVAPERLRAGRDDASFLGWADPVPHADADAGPAPLLVSLSAHLGDIPRDHAVAGLARALDELAAHTGAPIVFHPHFGSLAQGVSAGDQRLHDEVASSLNAPATLLGPGLPRAAARLARGAAMLVTSRYHPSVFATPAGVPVAALTVDEYTAVKLSGATRWWDREDAVVGLAEAAGPDGGKALREVWSTRDAARERSGHLLPEARADAARWWDRVADALMH